MFRAMLHHQNDELIILKQEKEKAELELLSDQRKNEKELHACKMTLVNEQRANEKELHACKMAKEAKNMEILEAFLSVLKVCIKKNIFFRGIKN